VTPSGVVAGEDVLSTGTGCGAARVPHPALEGASSTDHDDAALAEFCDREYPRLVRALSLYCGHREVAEELAQEALVRAIERWPSVQAMRSPGGWVQRVAFNLARSSFRRRVAERRANARSESGETGTHLDPDAETALVVRQAVAALPPRQRTVVIMRFYLDHPVETAAAALGLSPSATTSLTHRALQRLSHTLGDDWLGMLPYA
jgi:RNA polymerase sigma factor (sigma-70 family)